MKTMHNFFEVLKASSNISASLDVQGYYYILKFAFRCRFMSFVGRLTISNPELK